MDQQTLKQALSEVLDDRNRIDAERHRLHHDFIDGEIERRRTRKERWEKVRVHVLGWSAVSVIGAAIVLLGEGVRQFLVNLFKIKAQ